MHQGISETTKCPVGALVYKSPHSSGLGLYALRSFEHLPGPGQCAKGSAVAVILANKTAHRKTTETKSKHYSQQHLITQPTTRTQQVPTTHAPQTHNTHEHNTDEHTKHCPCKYTYNHLQRHISYTIHILHAHNQNQHIPQAHAYAQTHKST